MTAAWYGHERPLPFGGNPTSYSKKMFIKRDLLIKSRSIHRHRERKRDWMTTTTTSHFISLNGAESSQPTSTTLAFFCPFIVGELF